MKITAKDFQRLWESACSFDKRWAKQYDRFEPVTEDDEVESLKVDLSTRKAIYWFGQCYASVLLAKEFLLKRKHSIQVVWDMAEHQNGDILGYAIITDYDAEKLKQPEKEGV
jgi:hypothetical protein